MKVLFLFFLLCAGCIEQGNSDFLIVTQGKDIDVENATEYKIENFFENVAKEKKCGLANWTEEEVESYAQGGLTVNQTEISERLENNPKIKAIYLDFQIDVADLIKKIPQCSSDIVNIEFTIQSVTWLNLIKRFKDRLFIVNAKLGGRDFNNEQERIGSLWSSMSPQKNLMIVGSPKSDSGVLVSPTLSCSLEEEKKYSKGACPAIEVLSLLADLFKINKDPNPSLMRAYVQNRITEKMWFEEIKVPQWYVSLHRSCGVLMDKDACSRGIQAAIEGGWLWGDISKNFATGNKAWNKRGLEFKFDPYKKTAGEYVIIVEDEVPYPVLEFDHSMPFHEFVITLNHEMVHYANSKKLLELRSEQDKKINGCITKYQLSTLLDETKAFKAEIKFWEHSPIWFKKLFMFQEFDSKLTGRKNQNYQGHYEYLKNLYQRDPLLGSNLYIKLGQYPVCSKHIIQKGNKEK